MPLTRFCEVRRTSSQVRRLRTGEITHPASSALTRRVRTNAKLLTCANAEPNPQFLTLPGQYRPDRRTPVARVGTDLRARPIFHHTREAIEAHLTIVFAALAVAHYLTAATGMSIKKIVQALPPTADHGPDRRPRTPRRRPPHPDRSRAPREAEVPRPMTHPGGTSQVRGPEDVITPRVGTPNFSRAATGAVLTIASLTAGSLLRSQCANVSKEASLPMFPAPRSPQHVIGEFGPR